MIQLYLSVNYVNIIYSTKKKYFEKNVFSLLKQALSPPDINSLVPLKIKYFTIIVQISKSENRHGICYCFLAEKNGKQAKRLNGYKTKTNIPLLWSDKSLNILKFGYSYKIS